MTPRRRGAHCELTFHSFSRETRSRVVLLLPSYSCTSPAIIYLEIRGSSPSQALIPRSSGVGYHSSFPHIRIYIYVHILSTPFLFSPRTILVPFFSFFPFLSSPFLFLLHVRSRFVSAVVLRPSTIYLACPVSGTGHVCARVRA